MLTGGWKFGMGVAGATLLAAQAIAAQLVSGRVYSGADSTAAIRGARVVLRDTVHNREVTATTNDAGAFSIVVDNPSTYRMTVTSVGYQQAGIGPFAIGARDNQTFDVPMAPVATDLPEQRTVVSRTVEARPFSWYTEFERRRERGVGQFMEEADIRRFGSADIATVLTSISGVRRAQPVFGGPSPLLISMHSYQSAGSHTVTTAFGGTFDEQFAAANTCPVVFYLNGRKQNSDNDRADIMWTKVMPVYDLTAGAVSAIEVYRGQDEYPSEYASADARCGVIALWTLSAGP